ncbi:MAG: DNA translocase FtsK, partial [Candidatus Hydrogenedens sp.]
MLNYHYITVKKVLFSTLFLLVSILLFTIIIFNPEIHSDREADTPVVNIPFLLPIILGTKNIVYQIFLAIGPAVHFLYIILFLWSIILWDERYPFSFIQGFLGLSLLLTNIAIFSQAYYLFWTGKLAAGNSIGYRIVAEILVPNFGVFPSVLVSFMLILAGLILSLDWLFIYLLRTIYFLFSAFYNYAKELFISAKHGIEWINANIISLEQYTVLTEPSSVQLQLPLNHVNEDNSHFHHRSNVDTSCLPDLPLTEMEQDPPEMCSQSTSPVSTLSRTENTDKFVSEASISESIMGKGATKNIKEKKGGFWNFSKKENKELPKNNPTLSYISSEEPVRSGHPSQHKSNNIQMITTKPDYPEQYTKPPLTLLDEPVPFEIPNYNEQLQERAEILIRTLERFGVKARVTGITHGPTITRYELEPEPGIKVTRFLSHADDITLALKADRVRVEAPIPGRGKVGIEVPNPVREQVLLRELLESYSLMKHRGRLRLPLGKDITGEVKVVDLTQMPHLLIAGATGSGKTVFVKALLASLLFQYTPDELRLVLIDPKMVEFSIFNDIPHLLEPVVTDAKKAGEALDILVKEMERRYTLFANTNTRNLEIYNQNVENGQLEIYEDGDRDLFSSPIKVVRKLPHIVCIIDELADLMMLQRNAVESAIARLSQLARAVGIHLIVATQRPSVDVITGVIKANFPARISFQVSSKIDSRCILDTIGAEKLI